MTIGENIKKVRKSRGLTQKQLAEMIDKKEITIRRYEKGDIEPPISVINDIAESLMVSTTDLIPVNNEDLNRWDNNSKLIKNISLGNYSTNELIEELNNRNDFPIRIEKK